MAREHTEEAVLTLVELMRNGFPDSIRGAAANALLNRGWGLPRQSIETNTVLPPVERMSLAQVEAELARLGLTGAIEDSCDEG